MSKKYMDFVIDEDGGVTIEAHGFTDGSCRQATKDFETALGKVAERKLKNQTCAAVQTVKTGQGK